VAPVPGRRSSSPGLTRHADPRLGRRSFAGGVAAVAGVAALPAAAQLTVTIDRGTVKPLPIAVSPFHGAAEGLAEDGRRIAQVVGANLERSGLFRVVDPRAYIQTPAALAQAGPRFADWRQLDAEALVMGVVRPGDGDAVVVEFRLFDVAAGTELRGLRFTVPRAQWRRVAHKVADEVYTRITGEGGYFDTRIVYVAESGPPTQRVKRLAIMDQDGADHRFLTRGEALVLTPRFAPDGRNVAYLTYAYRTPQVALLDVDSGEERVLGDFPGMTFSPRFSPDGRYLALTLAEGGNSDLYLLDRRSGERRRLTRGGAIDTSPAFDPKGERLVFNSDRGGSPQLYVMDLASGRSERISFGEGRYGSPAWSPRGDRIAFVNQKAGDFHIGVMRADGRDARLLTRSYMDEGPRFAPNGRVLAFARTDPRRGNTKLQSIDVAGFNLRTLPTPLDASDPDWSPLRP
jgi:TolB protein